MHCLLTPVLLQELNKDWWQAYTDSLLDFILNVYFSFKELVFKGFTRILYDKMSGFLKMVFIKGLFYILCQSHRRRQVIHFFPNVFNVTYLPDWSYIRNFCSSHSLLFSPAINQETIRGLIKYQLTFFCYTFLVKGETRWHRIYGPPVVDLKNVKSQGGHFLQRFIKVRHICNTFLCQTVLHFR